MLLGSYYKSSAVLINVTGLVFENNWKSSIRKLPLMMSDFRGGWGSEMIPKNQILEGNIQRLGGEWGVKNRWTSFMDDPRYIHIECSKQFL